MQLPLRLPQVRPKAQAQLPSRLPQVRSKAQVATGQVRGPGAAAAPSFLGQAQVPEAGASHVSAGQVQSAGAGSDARAAIREAPLSSHLPPFQSVPKSLASVLGPPPPARALLPRPEPETDKEALLASAISNGELPDVRPPENLASAVLAQSRALAALAGHLSLNSDPVLDPQTTTGSRGSQSRQKLQAELAQMSGRFGGFAMGLIAYQVARAFDLLSADRPQASADALGLLLVYQDQLCLDSGSTTVAWLMTLLPDPPQAIFTNPPPLPGGSCSLSPSWPIRPGSLRPLGDGPDHNSSGRSQDKGPCQEAYPCGPSDRDRRSRNDPKAATSRAVGRQKGGCSRKPEVAHQGGSACPLEGPGLPFEGEFTFSRWAGALPRLVLKSGTAFAYFLSRTLRLSRDDAFPVPTALFPLPLPDAFPVGSKSRRRGGRSRPKRHMKAAMRVVCMALNFIHAGFRPVPAEALRRPPSDLQVSVFKRVAGYLKASCRLGFDTFLCRQATRCLSVHGGVSTSLSCAPL